MNLVAIIATAEAARERQKEAGCVVLIPEVFEGLLEAAKNQLAQEQEHADKA